jgi:hypothetical protein
LTFMPSASQSRSKSTKSESPVAARAELDQQQVDDDAQREAQEQTAKDQERQQADELKAGAKSTRGAAKLKSVAEQRTGREGEKPLFGRVDNMTRRDDSDPLEGHFVVIDYGGDGGKEAQKLMAAALGEQALGGREVGVGVADFGVYTEPGELGSDGYPVTAVVMLRGEFQPLQVTVPYAALRPAASRGVV